MVNFNKCHRLERGTKLTELGRWDSSGFTSGQSLSWAEKVSAIFFEHQIVDPCFTAVQSLQLYEEKQLLDRFLCEDIQIELSEAMFARLNDFPTKNCLAKPNYHNQMVQN